MKLNIYDKKQIVKTYTADTYDLMFGTLEDVAEAVHLDDMKTGNDTELLTMAMNFVMHSMDTVKDLIKDIFEGITDDELRNTKVAELADVLLDVIKYTLSQMGKLKTKN